MKPISLAPSQVQKQIAALGPWFHNMDIAGVATAPDHFLGDYPRIKWERFSHAIPADLSGKSVLDVGCNAGFYSLEMKRRGARRVVGIDSDDGYLAQARFAASAANLEVEYRRMSVYDLPRLGERFDVVLFLGVLYHLRHPLLALEFLYDHAVGETLVFQSMLRGDLTLPSLRDDYPITDERVFDESNYPRLHFVEHSYASDPTNWWIPNRACAEAMLRSAGFEIVDHPEEEVFICRRGERGPREHEGLIEIHERTVVR